MPKKNKRKFFGKSNKNKSPKLNQQDAESSERQQNQQQQNERHSDENYEEAASATQEEVADERKSEAIAGTSLVVNDSAPAMGQLESVSNSNDVSETPREELQHKATITLKVIQFVGEHPKQARDNESAAMEETMRHVEEQEPIVASAEINEIENDDKGRDNKSIIDDDIVAITRQKSLHGESDGDAVGVEPEIDHNKEDEALDGANRHQRERRTFDDNYRVESPKQVCTEISLTHRPKRHAMLIQEISESSSSEEVKQFLDDEATALEMKVEEVIIAPSPRNYRVDSPESSDDNNSSQVLAPPQDDVMVHEISESSSSESVKNEILASISKQLPTQKSNDAKPVLRVINIKELPSEDGSPSNSKMSSTAVASSSKITIPQFECKTERKLNKAEEAILEALYGNKSLLQINNLPLDVISEEGSDCGSDIDKQASSEAINDELDDDVFLPLSSVELSKKPPSSRRRYDLTKRAVAEQPLLINTKIIEAESNIPEGCKSWETTQSDSELQAELVYLTSASSSATDLSERGGDITEEEDADTSEDTETNSLLENISVPSLDNINKNDERDTLIEMSYTQSSSVYSSDYYQEINEQKLPDILEEDEDQAPRSIDISVSQQQIEDVNEELHHLFNEHEESQRGQSTERVSDEIRGKEEEEAVVYNEKNEEHEKALEDAPETIRDIVSDKKIISENDKAKDDALFNRVTPTLSKRKNSSDSSTSSANSQCTIISQRVTADHNRVDPLKDMCIQSLKENGFTLGGLSNNKDMHFTFHKKHNSASRNAPQIPVINELELHYECDNNDDIEGRENQQERVITILQVPPEINYSTASSMQNVSKSSDKCRWLGLRSSQIPNLLVALSPLQKSYMMSSQDSNTNADVLLDMHKKFVERRAYHEPYESEEIVNSDDSRQMNESQLEAVNQLEDGYFGDRESSVENIISTSTRAKRNVAVNKSSESSANCDNNQKDEEENISTKASCHEDNLTVKSAKVDNKMNSIRNCLLRDEFFKSTFTEANRDVDVDSQPSSSISSNLTETFEVKKSQMEDEMQRLDNERRELEEELKNLQSLQHFKREEFLFNEKKLQDELKRECQPFEIRRNSSSSSSIKYANDDFNEFIYSNEKLQQELYNEWQDKVLERNERKLQKTIKITSITETVHHNDESNLDRVASEKIKIVPLENEFMTKLKERRKRLSLTTEVEANSSTESLHHQNEESKKISPKVVEDVPAHLHEILKYYEEEIAQSKNSDESGESKIAKSLFIGCLIGVSMCLCGFYFGKQFITQK